MASFRKTVFAGITFVVATFSSTTLSNTNILAIAQPKQQEKSADQPRTFVTLDDLIQDTTFLEKYSPLTISGPYETFKISESNEIVVEQNFILQSHTFIKDKLQLMFGEGEYRQDPRNFLGTVTDIIQYLKQSDIQNQELTKYIASFKVIKTHQFNGQLQIVRFDNFQSAPVGDKNNFNNLIDDGIIAQNRDYYYLPKHLLDQITIEAKNSGLYDNNIMPKEKIFKICTLLANMIDYDSHANDTFYNRSLEETRKHGKGECREIVQYVVQIYYSLIKPKDNKLCNTYILPVIFEFSQDGVSCKHTISLLVDTQNSSITLFDPSQIIQVKNEVKRLQQKIQQISLFKDKSDLEQQILLLQGSNYYDCSTYSFKARRNNH